MTDTSVLELSDVSKVFGGTQALKSVSFDLLAGEVHALVGENGAGKSTLMKILAGIHADYDGTYTLDRARVHLRSPRDALQKGIGMIHQELSVLPELSVAENFFLGHQPRGVFGLVDWKAMRAIASRELAAAGFGHIDPRRPLGDYPLGIHQVVEMLAVIRSGARILIMDEPTSALSPAEVERLIELIRVLRSQNRSIVFISHFLDDVLSVADRITILRNGRSVSTVARAQASVEFLVAQMLGREIDPHLPIAVERASGDVLLEAEGLSGDSFADVSFAVRKGEIVGLYGPVGAGHFDVARAIFGREHISRGRVSIEGRQLRRNFSTADVIRRGVAYATESRRKSLFLRDPVFRNVTLPHLRRLAGFVPDQRKEVAITEEVIARVGLNPPDPLKAVGNFSGGNQQKVAIARWLTIPPKVLMVSEPTRGMDVGAKNDVLRILRGLRNDGYGVLLVSSEPETVLAIADSIATFSRGRMRGPIVNQGISKDTLMKGI